VKLCNKTILIVSPEYWGSNHVSKHHYALELVTKGCSVYFLDPPANKDEVFRVSEGLVVIKYKQRFRGLNRLPHWIRIPLLKIEIAAITKLIDDPIDVIWSFDPFRFQDLDLFKTKLKIFHSADLIFSKWDLYTAQKADLVLTTNAKILKRYQGIDRPIYNIGHGLSEYFIKIDKSASIPSFKQHPHRIAVGYCGNMLMQHLDREAFKKALVENQELDFYLIGPYMASNLSEPVNSAERFINFIKNQANCFLLGPKPPIDLFQYLHQMDILFICYQTNTIDNPHKTLEYLSTGKVVVSNYMQSYELRDNLIEMTKDNNQIGLLLSKVATSLKTFNSQEKRASRILYARERSYQEKIKEIEQLITDEQK